MGKDELPQTTAFARDSSQNKVNVVSYPNDKALLSDEILRLICEFVTLDNYFFYLMPPAVCLGQIESDMLKIQNTSLQNKFARG
mmetsp:Transcript_27128/g.40796  ORF Transcript_27128/g.40796 Transcript_27128/m.40796 type:complete len:84 (+) Transcript_27128:460-711(+)